MARRWYVQEVGGIQRTLDEFGEDILFLSAALTNDSVTPLDQRYLDSFYEEEFDAITGKQLHRRKRDMVPREKIVAYITRVLGGTTVNPSIAIDNAHHINKVYSGLPALKCYEQVCVHARVERSQLLISA
jgi:hypothetical protein